MLFAVGPLCIGLISACFKVVRSIHNHTFLFGLGNSTKLLDHSDISSTPYTTCFVAVLFSLLPSLTCIKNMPSKQPMPKNTSSNSL